MLHREDVRKKSSYKDSIRMIFINYKYLLYKQAKKQPVRSPLTFSNT